MSSEFQLATHPRNPKLSPQSHHPISDAEEDVVVIGIDFGTTFSGAAWATKADFESKQINSISSWPGTGREEPKVPTELFYEHGKTHWGYTVPLDADPVRWFKLLLLKDEDMAPEIRSSEFVLRGRKMLRENDTLAIDVIADYLGALWVHVIDNIMKARGDVIVSGLPFHVVITVPAIWKGYARQEMETAARKSGILKSRPAGPTTLSFAPEPESAALYTLSESGRKCKVGDIYLICDAGGGTVDLITYRVDGINPIRLQEAVEGTGGLCGGIFIDEGFERICKNRLGRQWDHLSKTGIKEIMRQEWEYAIKPQYKRGDDKKEYIVAIPAEAFGSTSLDDTSREPFIKHGRIHFKSEHIEEAFKAPLAGIVQLINDQIASAKAKSMSLTARMHHAPGIILVGGLGASPYLYDHLKDIFAKDGIEILQSGGTRPRTAICHGAVSKGFLDATVKGADNIPRPIRVDAPIKVTSTISRAHLGTSFMAHFNKNLHAKEDKFWDEDECATMAANQMQWYLAKGENVLEANPIRYKWYRTLKKDRTDTSFTETIYQCEEPESPGRMTSAVKELCVIDYTLDVAISSLQDWTNPKGVSLKRFNFEIEMKPAGASVEFAVYFNRRRQGGQHVNIRFI